MFDRYVTVDWSAAGRPRTGRDSVWICSLGPAGPASHNPRTRGAATVILRGLLTESARRGERVLVGFDFPYAYPAGFAAALGLAGPAWRAVWDLLAAEIHDDPHTNVNNRFAVADALNQRLGGQAAFWGHPVAHQYGHLPPRRVVTYRPAGTPAGPGAGLAEWRETEAALRASRRWPQPAWKLSGAGSVGGQALTGIPVVARLRFDPALAGISHVWPFEPVPGAAGGWPLPGTATITHAEVWPSMYPRYREEPGTCADQRQVRHLCRLLSELDSAGRLAWLMSRLPPRSAEEGWILGVEPPSGRGAPSS